MTREEDIGLMDGAQERIEATARRWMRDPDVRRAMAAKAGERKAAIQLLEGLGYVVRRKEDVVRFVTATMRTSHARGIDDATQRRIEEELQSQAVLQMGREIAKYLGERGNIETREHYGGKDFVMDVTVVFDSVSFGRAEFKRA